MFCDLMACFSFMFEGSRRCEGLQKSRYVIAEATSTQMASETHGLGGQYGAMLLWIPLRSPKHVLRFRDCVFIICEGTRRC